MSRSSNRTFFFLGPLIAGLLLASVVMCNSGSSPSRSRSVVKNKPTWDSLDMVNIPVDEATAEEPSLTRNFYFIFDGSGSMGENTDANCGGDQRFPDKHRGALWAIDRFLESVPEDVNLGLYAFDNNAASERLAIGPNNRESFRRQVNAVNVGGGTPLAEAIVWGTDRLVEQYQRQLGYGEFRLVVITDGKANGLQQAAYYAARRGVPIYTIGLCVGQNHPLRRYSVSYRAADRFEDLASGLTETLAELPNYDATDFEAGAATEAPSP